MICLDRRVNTFSFDVNVMYICIYNMEKFNFYLDSNSDPSVVQPVASRYTDCATTARPKKV
jgi:hypothetical protein